MTCAWQEFLTILPQWVRNQMDDGAKLELRELRLRIGHAPELILGNMICRVSGVVRKADLDYCVNAASRYSPWASQTVAKGYITACGGHRIGLCGDAIIDKGHMQGIKSISSICVRVARDYPGIAQTLDACDGSILLIGPPGSGKTTMLRDLVRRKSVAEQIAVVDERGEIFPECFMGGECSHFDVLSGCPKTEGIEILLRTMGPSTIAVDEITAQEDCNALMEAAWCGVHLLATVHASELSDLRNRKQFRLILESKVFEWFIIMQRDLTWKVERMYA